MPLLSQHQSNSFTKMILLGDPGTAKTGGCTSLVKAGYKLGILDYDNGLDVLSQFVNHECPDKINNIVYRTLRDKKKSTPTGMIVDGPATAFQTGMNMLDRWKHGDQDLGSPAAWGKDWIFILDSLTHCARAAFDACEQMSMGSKNKDPRIVYFKAQQAVETMLANLTSEFFKTNVIVIAHVNYVDNEDGTRKGYPNAIGKALSPIIGSYFNSIALCSTKAGGRRVIQTAPTALIDLKNPAPFAMLPEYPISTGLADFFEVLRPSQPMKLVKG